MGLKCDFENTIWERVSYCMRCACGKMCVGMGMGVRDKLGVGRGVICGKRDVRKSMKKRPTGGAWGLTFSVIIVIGMPSIQNIFHIRHG